MAEVIGQCCCGGGGGEPCCSCTAAVTLSREWSFALAAPANGLCAACAQYGGSFTLRWSSISSGCQSTDWRAAPPLCGFNQPGVSIGCNFHHTWELTYINGSQGLGYYLRANVDFNLTFNPPTYFKLGTAWLCGAANTLDFVGDPDGVCANWPAQVTLTPAAPIQPVCRCWPAFDAIAQQWTARLQGFVGDPDCCESINGDHILQKNVPPCSGVAPFRQDCVWGKLVTLPGKCGPPVCISMEWLPAITGMLHLNIATTSPPPPFNVVYDQYYLPAVEFNPVGLNTFRRRSPRCEQTFGDACNLTPATVEVVPA